MKRSAATKNKQLQVHDCRGDNLQEKEGEGEKQSSEQLRRRGQCIGESLSQTNSNEIDCLFWGFVQSRERRGYQNGRSDRHGAVRALVKRTEKSRKKKKKEERGGRMLEVGLTGGGQARDISVSSCTAF